MTSHPQILLASRSAIRCDLLIKSGVRFEALPARLDEAAIRAALEAEGAHARDQADALAEMKAAKIAQKHPEAVVIGCDQVLEFEHRVMGKPESLEEARGQLLALRGRRHKLLSAVVVYHQGQPVWRHVGEVRLEMREFSDGYLESYLARHGTSLFDTVGGYKLEEEGVRLFSQIEGDYFTVLGLPLVPLLNYLGQRGFIEQ